MRHSSKKKGKKRKIKKNLVSRCSQLRSSKGNLLACFCSHASACIPFQTSSLACFFFLVGPLRISSFKVASTAVLMCFVMFHSPKLWWASWRKHVIDKVLSGTSYWNLPHMYQLMELTKSWGMLCYPWQQWSCICCLALYGILKGNYCP